MNNLWILTYDRTGSSFLCEILNNTNLFNPKVLEYFNNASVEENSNIFKKTPKKFKNCKILWRQFQRTKFSREYLEKNLPDTKFVILKRKDIYARAISLYFAKMTQVWRLYRNGSKIDLQLKEVDNKFKFPTDTQDEWLRRVIPFNEDQVLKCFETACAEQENSWLEFDNALNLEYEDLILNPLDIVGSVLKYLGADMDQTMNSVLYQALKTCNTISSNRPESEEYIERLKKLVSLRIML